MHQLGKADLPQLLKGLNAKLAGKSYPPSNVHGSLVAEEVMREEGRTADNVDRQHWYVDRWPDFRVIMHEERLPSFECPVRAVWTEDDAAAAEFFAHPAFRIPEFWLGGVEPAILDALRSDYTFYNDSHSDVFVLSPEGVNALSSGTDCAREGLTYGPVAPEDAELVAKHVTYPCTAAYVRTILSCGLPSVAARLMSDGTLVAWALTQPYLALGMLNVMPGHRRSGLGRAVVTLLAKQQLARGWTSYAYVSGTNVGSVPLFESLGYKRVGRAHWTGCKIRGPS
ncbi:hypothetical protein KFL_001820120 [Klebsormidium nitens]|uniref:N-acetyltransferase domain-containing protein n=1 Tax=Klebsormidium nitens TaxID=105231 RepID=A0A1Y1I4A3_KLENI|nr:hypothetical protein KFL_001820120 [Klebsormidium nitens]|eukprot:GAQ84259.1 hypothetical protein KFL_001820120 [Klebsormidium nitens]